MPTAPKLIPPSNDKIAEAASALEQLAADLRAEADVEEKRPEDEKYESPAPGLRRKADWLDEVAAYLDDVRSAQ